MTKLLKSTILFLAGSIIFVLGNPYYDLFPTNGSSVFSLGITVFFLITVLILRFSKQWSGYWRVSYALFCASAALLFFSTGILNLHNQTMPAMMNLAVDKFSQFLHIVPVLVILTYLAGVDRNYLFIRKGRLKQGLTFGLISFAIFALVGYMIARTTGYLPLLIRSIPWVFLWAFANSIMEELWFRGIFLKPYEKIVGRGAAIIITALIFGVSHINAAYSFPGGGVVFGIVVFSLGVIGAQAIIKQESIIGAILFHAGYDLLIIIPVLQTL